MSGQDWRRILENGILHYGLARLERVSRAKARLGADKVTAKKLAIQVAGWVLVVLGVAGLFLPFLQGFLFLFAGLVVLSTQYQWARRLVERAKQRYPKMGERVDEFVQKMQSWFRSDRESGSGK